MRLAHQRSMMSRKRSSSRRSASESSGDAFGAFGSLLSPRLASGLCADHHCLLHTRRISQARGVDALPGVGGGVVAQHAEQVQAGRVGQNGSAVPGWGEGPTNSAAPTRPRNRRRATPDCNLTSGVASPHILCR